MANRVLVAERVDIERLTIVCGKCDTEVSIPAEPATIPVACPVCGIDYNEPMREAILAFRRFHRFAKAFEDYSGKVAFRVSIKTPE